MGLESYEQFTFADEVVADERNCTRTTAGRMARRALEGTISLAVELRNKSAIPTIDPCGSLSPRASLRSIGVLSSLRCLQEEQSVNSGRTAADGLYDDSTGGVPQQDKQITGRFPMATYNTAQIMHLGMLMMIPYFLEVSVQRGLFKAIKEVLRML